MPIPPDFDLETYVFDLPEEQIAQYPSQKRQDSRLLVVDRARGNITHDVFAHLADHLPSEALLVTNVSKVVPARLLGRKCKTQGQVEFLLLTPLPVIQAESEGGGWYSAQVEGLCKPAKGLSPGSEIEIGPLLRLCVIERQDFGRTLVRMQWQGELPQVLSTHGCLPLPPYIRRETGSIDAARYQTVYAREDKLGSVAAPTAGLHFTPALLQELAERGIECEQVALYVGYGTFSPVRSRDIRQHHMHAEYIEVSEQTAASLQRARNQGRPIVAVGTTTVRTLESVYAICGDLQAFTGWTDHYLYPGVPFHVVDHMITNFHLPRSSLMIMVSAFAGRSLVHRAYTQAVDRGYRFFSYGDAMLVL